MTWYHGVKEGKPVIRVELSSDKAQISIIVTGTFDFSVHQAFQEAYEQGVAGHTQYVIDLNGVDYMDSAALGMLLQLREYAGSLNSITIKTVRSDIIEILRISNFAQMFRVID